MSFLNLWKSNTRCIENLNASELASAAVLLLPKLGRNMMSSRLIFRALQLDPYQPQALLMLSEMFRGKKKDTRPTGDEIFSGLVIEYAVDRKSPLTLEQKRPFDKARMEILTLWGFVKPRAGELDVDHIGYMTYINELMGQVQSVTRGFQMAFMKLGVQSEFLDPVKGKPTRTYKEWMNSDASSLPRPDQIPRAAA